MNGNMLPDNDDNGNSTSLSDGELLSGLWWYDEEFSGTGARELWDLYVLKKHEFERLSNATALLLRNILNHVSAK